MTILVTGARGSVARAVIGRLVDAGEDVRAGSSDPAGTTLPDGVDVVAADLGRPELHAAALRGVSKVFLYAKPEGVDRFVEAAGAAGVKHIVLLSAMAAHDPEGLTKELAVWHLAAERAVASSGAAWTFLRPGAFATNALAWAPAVRAGGAVSMPYPDAHMNPVHEQDIAAVAVRALTEPGHEETIHSFTGPESLSQRQQVELIGAALGRDLRVEELSRARAERFMPGSVLDLMAANGSSPVPVGPTVREILGEPARTFTQWAIDHVADFG